MLLLKGDILDDALISNEAIDSILGKKKFLFWKKKERVVFCKHREDIFLPCEVEDGLY